MANEAVRRALELRRMGVVTVLVTGRTLSHLPIHALQGAFDALVLEGGAVWGRPGRWTVHPVSPGFWRAAEFLERAGHEVRSGWCSFSAPARAARDLAHLSGELGCQVNRDRIDVTPFGVDKATGLSAALSDLGTVDPWILAIGDAANDVPLAKAAHLSVAVANAEPQLADAAAIRAPEEAYKGFLWAVDRLGRPAMEAGTAPGGGA